MQTVRLDVTTYTSTGGVHANLIINGTDTGVLYLSANEKDVLMGLLQSGAHNTDDVFVDEKLPDEEIDIDIFDD